MAIRSEDSGTLIGSTEGFDDDEGVEAGSGSEGGTER